MCAADCCPRQSFVHAEAMTTDRCESYLRDLGCLILERAIEAAGTAQGDRIDQFAAGRSLAYYEVVSLMRNQALAFELDLAVLSLDGVNPERDLI